MEKFEHEGKKFWESFGESLELLPRVYFDFVSGKKYREALRKYNLRDRKVIDIGAGFPVPKELSEKQLTPLASELQEILESLGAKIITVDVAKAALEQQRKVGREPVLGNAFQLPFKNESIDGGAIILNLFNASFKVRGGREIFITLEECKKILQEVYRVLQKGRFVIVSHFGYLIYKIDNLIQFMGPQENEIITPEMIVKIAKEVGFQRVKNISLDKSRIKLGVKFAIESFPEPLRERITVENKAAGALLLEK